MIISDTVSCNHLEGKSWSEKDKKSKKEMKTGNKQRESLAVEVCH